MKPFIAIHDLVDRETGKTFKQLNLERKHNVPIGTLVEVKWDSWFGDGACWKVHARLWVVRHDRDCDGSPLYGLSRWNLLPLALSSDQIHSGFDEESLTVVEMTPDVRNGEQALVWEH